MEIGNKNYLGMAFQGSLPLDHSTGCALPPSHHTPCCGQSTHAEHIESAALLHIGNSLHRRNIHRQKRRYKTLFHLGLFANLEVFCWDLHGLFLLYIYYYVLNFMFDDSVNIFMSLAHFSDFLVHTCFPYLSIISCMVSQF